MALISDMDFMSYIDSLGIQYKEVGDELKFHHCPFCESGGKVRKPYGIFYFNRAKQVYQCYHKKTCGAQGTLYRFKLERGDISPINRGSKIVYKKPAENTDYTTDTDKFYQWYEKERGITSEILKKYSVGFYKRENNTPIIVYQYYDSDNKLFNRKYKSTDKKDLWTEKDAQKGYYGLQHINYEDDTLYVVEGEDDCHAFVQILGFSQVVSVPYGVNTYTPAMDVVNKKFNVIILMFDCDERGQEGARKFAEKAGLQKVHNVILPRKDLRDCVLAKLTKDDIQLSIAGCQRFKHESIIKPDDLKREFEDEILNKSNNLGYMTPWVGFNKLTKGVRVSELTVLTGHTGSGKTTFAYNLLIWAEQVGMNCLAMSFENRMSAIMLKLIEISSGEVVRMFDEKKNKVVIVKSTDWIMEEFNKINNKNVYFLNKENVKDGYYDVEKLYEIIMYAVKFYDIKFFLIDHLHYFLKLSDARNPVAKIDETIRAIKQITEMYKVHILLIVHPFKTADRDGKPVKLGINSGKGSSSISQESDNFWIISRELDTDPGEYRSCFEMHKNREFGVPSDNSILWNLKSNRNTFYMEEYEL